MYELAGRRVYVAGHGGLVGSALVRRLAAEGCELLTADRSELDLRDQSATFDWMERTRPQTVFVAAARVGGIHANRSFPAQFLYDNLAIAANVIEAARRTGVEKLLFLGSSCIYPRDASQPIREEALLTGPLEPTNAYYALAKIAGIKLVEAYRKEHGCDFISAMPANLYGPGDNFDLETSHVIPALIRKAHEAKQAGKPLVVWGSGAPRRELLHVDDCADACLFLMRHYSDGTPVNVGSGEDISIRDLAETIARVVGFAGPITFDPSRPDGTPRKCMDVSRMTALGWGSRIGVEEGLRQTYRWYEEAAA